MSKNLNQKMTRDIDPKTALIEELLSWYNENSGERKARVTLGSEADARKKVAELKEAISSLSGSTGSKEGAKKKAVKEAPKGAKKEGAAAGTRGRASKLAGKFLYKEVKDNPRREGTHGHKSFALIRDGMTYEAYIEAGGRSNDLAWDIEHGSVKVRDEKKPK